MNEQDLGAASDAEREAEGKLFNAPAAMSAELKLVRNLRLLARGARFNAVPVVIEAADTIDGLLAERDRLRGALTELRSFVSIMCGQGPDCIIPETVRAPLGVPVKIGDIMRNADAALTAPKEEV